MTPAPISATKTPGSGHAPIQVLKSESDTEKVIWLRI